MTITKKQIPNLITLVRFILTIVLVVLSSYIFIVQNDSGQVFIMSYKNYSSDLFILWIVYFCIFFVASITDFVDGYLARKWKVVSNSGKILDSIVDKTLTTASLIFLSSVNSIFLWLSILLILRDIIMSSIRMMNSQNVSIIEAKWHGKAKTFLLFLGILFVGFLSPLFFDISSTNDWSHNEFLALSSTPLIIACVFSYFSMFMYIKTINFKKNSAK